VLAIKVSKEQFCIYQAAMSQCARREFFSIGATFYQLIPNM